MVARAAQPPSGWGQATIHTPMHLLNPGHPRRLRFMEAERERIGEVIARLTYKPGTEFHLLPDDGSDTVTVMLRLPVEDAYGGGPTSIGGTVLFRLMELDQIDDMRIADKIMRKIVDLEVHEVQEWFRLDRRHVRDPHPELRR